ncbi:MAG: peptidoglycan-binding protein [Sedimentitalea sp.]
MALLKSGSSGPDVKKLQSRLNQLGAKLEADGEFGPLTDAALRKFQGKAKVKPDGKVGPITNAALIYGKALPKMETEDYVAARDGFQKMWNITRDGISTMMVIEKETTTLDNVWEKNSKEMDKIFVAGQKNWEKIADLSDTVIAKQAAFDKTLLTDPAKAEKLAVECAKLNAVVAGLIKSNINPDAIKIRGMAEESSAQFKTSSSKISGLLKGLGR